MKCIECEGESDIHSGYCQWCGMRLPAGSIADDLDQAFFRLKVNPQEVVDVDDARNLIIWDKVFEKLGMYSPQQAIANEGEIPQIKDSHKSRIELSVSMDIPDSEILCIIENAGYLDHPNNWLLGYRIDEKLRISHFTIDRQPNLPGDGFEEVEVSFDQILKVLVEAAPTNKNVMRDLAFLAIEGEFAGEMDAFDCDLVLQMATFGELRYPQTISQ